VFILRLLAAQVIAWKDWTPKALFVERDVKLYSLLTPYTTLTLLFQRDFSVTCWCS